MIKLAELIVDNTNEVCGGFMVLWLLIVWGIHRSTRHLSPEMLAAMERFEVQVQKWREKTGGASWL